MSVTEFTVQGILKSYLVKREASLKVISARPHFLPLSTNLLKVSLEKYIDTEKISVESFVKKVQNYIIATTNRRALVLKGTSLIRPGIREESITAANVHAYTPALILEGTVLRGILYASSDSYNSARRSIFEPFLNKEMSQYLIDRDSNYEKDFNVGHTEMSYNGSNIAATPSTEQLHAVISAAQQQKFTGKDSRSKNKVIQEILLDLQNLRENFELHSEYGTKISAKLSKEFKQALIGINANIVIIQDGIENRSWGVEENRLVSSIKSILTKIHFSRNIEEEIELRVTSALTAKVSPSSSALVNIEVFSKKKAPPVKSSSGPQKTQKVQQPKGLSRFKDLRGRFTSTTSISNLINLSLKDQIKKNMGKGHSKSLLNYRTGRLASSAKVTNIIRHRDDTLSIFYNYMRYPYATFEPEGLQGSPKTRDPKLLISKSIREIAATMVGNKLRAVRL
jgi:hypothetical protein